MLRPVRVSAPAVPLVTVTEMAGYAVLDFADDNVLVESLIETATAHFDGYSGVLGRCLVNQTWRLDRAGWCEEIRLPFPDVSIVTHVKYFDANNVEQTLASSQYELLEDARSSLIRFNDTFTEPAVYDDRFDAVRITFVAGYGAAASNVPTSIRLAVMMCVAHWYNNREGQGETPPNADALAAPYRRVGM